MNFNKMRHQIEHGKKVSPQIRFAVELVKTAQKASLAKVITQAEYEETMRLATVIAR